ARGRRGTVAPSFSRRRLSGCSSKGPKSIGITRSVDMDCREVVERKTLCRPASGAQLLRKRVFDVEGFNARPLCVLRTSRGGRELSVDTSVAAGPSVCLVGADDEFGTIR